MVILNLFRVCFLLKLAFVVFAFSACNSNYSRDDVLEKALSLAGDNRQELQKVLDYYSHKDADSLKYRAARFLIENMPSKHYYEGDAIDHHAEYFKSLHEHKQKRDISSLTIRDSINSLYEPFDLASTVKKYDILTIDSAYLCNNIEWSFKVWKEQPWGKHVNFEDFCEHILPYRIGDEQLADWKSYFFKKYNPILDKIKASGNAHVLEDPVGAAKVLMDSLNKYEVYFTSTNPNGYPRVGPMVSEYLAGTCRELTDFAVYVYRALGIPCQVDFMPMRNDHFVGHEWVSLYDKEGELFGQDYPEALRKVSDGFIRDDPKMKVYRSTYRVNALLKDKLKKQTIVPPMFVDPTFVDVTEQYAICYAESVTIPDSLFYEHVDRQHAVYMAASTLMKWLPVAIGNRKARSVVFSSIQKGSVYRLMAPKNGRFIFLTDPFILDCDTDQITVLRPSPDMHAVTIYSKFPLHHDDEFRSLMVGGLFEGSNDRDFNVSHTLHRIEKIPYRLFNTVELSSKTRYQYVRYMGPKNGYLNIAELSFLHNRADSAVNLTGSTIGYFVDSKAEKNYSNVFDGGFWSSYKSDSASGDWVGLCFDQPVEINKIVYTPRNRDNYIKPDHYYELFYLDRTWKSLGQVKSSSDSLYYTRVPKNALLYLKSHSGGVQERVFTYEDGKTQWR